MLRTGHQRQTSSSARAQAAQKIKTAVLSSSSRARYTGHRSPRPSLNRVSCCKHDGYEPFGEPVRALARALGDGEDGRLRRDALIRL